MDEEGRQIGEHTPIDYACLAENVSLVEADTLDQMYDIMQGIQQSGKEIESAIPRRYILPCNGGLILRGWCATICFARRFGFLQ